MDLETENRIAAILMKEAAELRRQADREGVHAYLQKPTVRGRPNSRFLSATVLGVQQANRAVEVNEMWRVRQRELELNDRLNGRSKSVTNSSRNNWDIDNSDQSISKRHDDKASSSYISSKRVMEDGNSREDEGLGDEEVEKFLHSRTKRGRGSVGSRMDETGPFLSSSPRKLSPTPFSREQRVILGPERPQSIRNCESSSDEDLQGKLSSRKSCKSSDDYDDDYDGYHERRHKRKKVCTRSDKKISSKHKSSRRSRDKKNKRKEGRRK